MIEVEKSSFGAFDSRLVGRRVFLRPISTQDYDIIRISEQMGSDGLLYRHRGLTPSPEQFAATLWSGVLSQYMVVQKGAGQPVGTVTAYNADFRNGHAFIAALVFPAFRKLAWPLEGMDLFISSLFDAFPFRKLYAEVFEPNVAQFRSAIGDVVKEEGRLSEHEFISGRYVDRVFLSIARLPWEARSTEPKSLADFVRSRLQTQFGDSVNPDRHTDAHQAGGHE